MTSKTRKKQAVNAPRGRDTFKENPFSVVILGVDTSDPPADHDLTMLLHKHRIEKPIDQELLDSISANGVEQPITTAKVWLPVGMKLHGKELKVEEQVLIAVDGRRRTLTTRQLCVNAGDKDGTKKTFILPTLSPKTGMTIRELAGLAIELNETSKHDDVLEKAAQARLMVARTQDEAWVAARFHVDVQTLKNWFKLRGEAAAPVLEAVKSKRGGLNATGATKLTRLPPSKQVEVMEEAIASKKTSAAQIDGLVRKAIAESKGVKASERPNGAPPKRQLAAAISVIEDSELDTVDDMMGRERAWVEVLKWAHTGIVSNKAVAELDKKSRERMNGKQHEEIELPTHGKKTTAVKEA